MFELMNEELTNRNKNINRGYRKLDVWKEGISLFVFVRNLMKELHDKVKAQIEDSALSVPSNITEGYSRRSLKENIQFNTIALASMSENYTQIFALHSCGDISKEKFDEI